MPINKSHNPGRVCLRSTGTPAGKIAKQVGGAASRRARIVLVGNQAIPIETLIPAVLHEAFAGEIYRVVR